MGILVLESANRWDSVPKNDKNIKAKNVAGKKYILNRFVVTIVVCLIWLLLMVLSVVTTGGYETGLICTAITSVLTVPIIILDILRSFGIIGQFFVLSDEGLYYFRARTVINNKFEKSNGYVPYSKIKNVVLSMGYKHSNIIIQGNRFEISIESASQKLIKEIKTRAHLDDDKFELYDAKGICYTKYSDVTFYDKNGLTYKISGGVITDQNGKKYDREYCYVDSNGHFYYAEEEMDFYDSLDENFVEYYTDGKEIYVSLRYFVYWNRYGKMYCYDGTLYYELTEFNKN